MKMQIGGFGTPKTILDDERIEFVAEDGRTMYEVWIGRDGISLEISGSSVCNVAGQLYEARFFVIPRASNSIVLRAQPYQPAETKKP